ncbi:MAG: universal stress protein [Acidimicrobiia bacterium]|nr:universal stress protein [Acidimicrobiia bacterium]
MNTIILGLDGSNGSQVAARWTTAAAGPDTRVVAAHVMQRSELWTLGALQVDARPIVDELKALLDGKWTEVLRKAGVPHTTRFLRGDPASELLRLATRTNALMLVIGTKSHRSVHDLVVGGTAHKIINRSTVPVTLVPHPLPRSKVAR